jgi:hypothetical protein
LTPVKRVAEDGFTGDSLCVSLRGGRKIGVPLTGEDPGAEDRLRGAPAPREKTEA